MGRFHHLSGGGVGVAGEQCRLGKGLARVDEVQQQLAALGRVPDELDLTGQHDEERLGLLALVEHDFASGECALVPSGQHAGALLGGELFEQRESGQ